MRQETRAEQVHQKMSIGGMLSKSIGLAALKKTVVKHKAAEHFENQRLQTFIRDMGIDIQDGKGNRVRPKMNCRALQDWPLVDDMIRNRNQPPEEVQIEETKVVRSLLRDIDFHNNIMTWGELSPQEEFELTRSTQHIFRKKGEQLFSAGQKDDKFYIVLRGKVAFTVPRSQAPQAVLKAQQAKEKKNAVLNILGDFASND